MSSVLDQGAGHFGHPDAYVLAKYTLLRIAPLLDPVMSMSIPPMYERINEEPFPFFQKTEG
jgi:hypothetical protein